MTDIGLLLAMLAYRRPSGSPTEHAFINRFIAPLGATQDDYGNWHVWIANADGSPSRILWSCHTDTVHRSAGMQTIHYNPFTGVASLSRRARKQGSNCLGADNTAGVFLCISMIKANVPGHYIFHYGEESGGQGSRDLAQYEPALLANAEIAIALDRRGHGDIITSQFGQRTASDQFAWSLSHALELADTRLQYAPAAGIYTDTAEYAAIIPECTNLSVGYWDEHRSSELLDTVHVLRLLHALIALDTSRLVINREPVAESYQGFSYVDADLSALCSCGHAESLHDSQRLGCYYCWCVGFTCEPSYLLPEYAEVQRALHRAQTETVLAVRPNTLPSVVIPWKDC